MLLEGEDNTHEWQPENEPATPLTSAATTPNPPDMETPIHELHCSSHVTDKPNYKLLTTLEPKQRIVHLSVMKSLQSHTTILRQ